MKFVWVLNPDAERELAAVASYAVKAAFKSRISERRPLFAKLCQEEPFFFSHELEPAEVGVRALLWCPTSHGRRSALDAGLLVSASPTMQVLRMVHDKRFLSQALEEVALSGRAVIGSEEEWRYYLAHAKGDTRVKRFFGYAGKGQRVWKQSGARDDERWLADSLRQGGFVAEPNWSEARQISMHGFVDRRGIILGDPCALETDKFGAPISVRRLALPEVGADGGNFHEIAARTAEKLLEFGYFGPFGLDILCGPDGPRLIDLNPRFTLGWSQGLGLKRSTALERALTPVPSGPDWC